jgi:hypothetical protein
MGIFFDTTEVINRTSKKLNVRFDGQDTELEPNYDAKGNLLPDVHNLLPTIAVAYAKNQNILMGSEDPLDPSSFEVLVGVKAKKGERQRDDISFCEQSNEPTPVKLEELLDDPNLKIQSSGRKIRASDARPIRGTTPFEPRVS